MTLDLTDIGGLFGSALMAAGYIYSNVANRLNFVLFNGLNLVGSLLVIASLLVHFNVSAMAMEIMWAGIAAFGLVKALRRPAAR